MKTSTLPRSAPLGSTSGNPARHVWTTAAALLRTLIENVRVRRLERRDRRRLEGEWLTVEVKTWVSAKPR